MKKNSEKEREKIKYLKHSENISLNLEYNKKLRNQFNTWTNLSAIKYYININYNNLYNDKKIIKEREKERKDNNLLIFNYKADVNHNLLEKKTRERESKRKKKLFIFTLK